jgi:hypothetical protein
MQMNNFYKTVSILGKGSFCTVFKVEKLNAINKFYANKSFSKAYD